MLDGNSSISAHRLQNLLLLLLGLILLPLDTYLTFMSYIFGRLFFPHHPKQLPDFKRRTILVTGIGMTKGLVLARAFHEEGHLVIGADFEPNGALVCGRFSRSISKFHRLQKPTPTAGSAPYIQSLLNIVTREKVDLWVSCSGVASAVEDGEAKEIIERRTNCKAVQFNVETTRTLHEKDAFIEHTASLGLTVPETHTVKSRKAVEEILRRAPLGRKYIMKTIGVDDTVRGNMTLLPRPTSLETSEHIARMKISEKTPWIVQQFIKGSEYCTHSVVIRGQVKLFLACPSAELLMHYKLLAPSSSLSQAMLKFTQTYAEKGGDEFTGHLSFDFLVEDEAVKTGKNIVLYPIECNPRAHTAVALFQGTPGTVDAYLTLLDQSPTAAIVKSAITPTKQSSYYWVGHDLVDLVILGTWDLLRSKATLDETLTNYRTFLNHLFTWKDGTFEIWDPLPWWALYHIYWPMRFLDCFVTGKKWSRINVSTTKMFEC